MALPVISSLVRASDYEGGAALLDDQILVYQPVSGSIQLVDMLGHEILKLVAERALSISQLVDLINQNFDTSEIEDIESAILKVVIQFQAVDLVELDA
ncbi:MAG: hypothetical protein K9K86_11950 [Pseudomonadales bacterium]|nr:hypothetical protein [Pseudomonadales bacterium]